jgi:hypothetical protein
LGTLREQLLQIENECKTEEEARQKELTNATLQSTLFELVNNACTVLAQAQLDRWTSTRVLMIPFNQIISDLELVPALPHRKLSHLINSSLGLVSARRVADHTADNGVNNKICQKRLIVGIKLSFGSKESPCCPRRARNDSRMAARSTQLSHRAATCDAMTELRRGICDEKPTARRGD